MTDHPAASSPPRARIYRELLVVLLITFGMSGVRSLLRLIDAALSSTPLNQQTATLNASQADSPWLDLALQLCSAAVLCGWGLLVLYLLNPDKVALPKPRLGNLGSGAGLAALIGLPGLLFYLGALQLGFTKNVVPSTKRAGRGPPTRRQGWREAPVLLVWSFANAFAEETVVVLWLLTRLKQLNLVPWKAVALSSLLRGSYHLYQGFSAGVGNIIMGVVFAWFYQRTNKIWPLVIAHFLIDALAFVGYAAFGESLMGFLRQE